MHLSGQRALVTGGSAGIGAAIATCLAEEGCEVIIVARDAGALAAQVAAIRTHTGMTVEPVAADLSTAAGVRAAARVANERGVDILVNNAGAVPPGDLFMDEQVWREAYELRFWGYVRMIRHTLPMMLARGSGTILNIVGNNGRQPVADRIPGGIVNAALINLTQALASQYASDGLRILALSPGPIRTDRLVRNYAAAAAMAGVSVEEYERRAILRIPAKRLGEAHEVGSLAAVLLSNRCAYLTGECVTVDGGMTAGVWP